MYFIYHIGHLMQHARQRIIHSPASRVLALIWVISTSGIRPLMCNSDAMDKYSKHTSWSYESNLPYSTPYSTATCWKPTQELETYNKWTLGSSKISFTSCIQEKSSLPVFTVRWVCTRQETVSKWKAFSGVVLLTSETFCHSRTPARLGSVRWL